tara:strand:+ start:5279 stop:7681 length:2403 start_codon:yes stop_codon:yes gene_type:complete
MIITLNWIKKHLNTNYNFEKILDKLTNIGLEVESVRSNNNELDPFIICKVLKAEKHPNADKLKVCDVDIGNNKITKVVCGAPNARNNLFTVYAPPGSIIPKNKMKLKIAKIRDVTSYGMLCSESELNLSDESQGIIEINKKDQDIGKNFFKLKKEKIADISITPNRPDCLGVRGIARDLAAADMGSLIPIKKSNLKKSGNQPIKIKIVKEKDQGCAAFGACYISGVQNKESPEWLKEKIISLGQKPISAIVDITNYIMLDLNRPLHAYDADKIDSEIIVRNSKKNESFEALDNKKYVLKENMCTISDKTGVLGLGGIIGGVRSGTEFNTKNILLESAYFFPKSIRKTARDLNIDTDAKYRFERGIDPNSMELGLEKAAELITSICGGKASKITVTGNVKKNKLEINLDSRKFLQTIGYSISNAETKKILENLGCKVKISKKNFKITPPSWRPDILQEIDLIEELARIKGFNNINLVEPIRNRDKETLSFRQKIFHFSQRSIVSKGYLETVTWSFTDSNVDKYFSELKNELKISNPISSDLDVLRSSIYSNLMIHVKRNLDRNFENLSLFEVGPIFYGKNPGEQTNIAGCIKTGKINNKNWIGEKRDVDIFDIKNDLVRTLIEIGINEKSIFISNNSKSCYHPGRSGSIKLKSSFGPHLAYFGELHPSIIKKMDLKCDKVFGFELFIDNIPTPNKKIRTSKPKFNVSDFQKSERDFAFVIDKNYGAQELINLVKEVNKNIIRDVKVFDLYQGENIPMDKKSIALNVTLQAIDKTLNEKDLEDLSQKIISIIKDKTGAIIRS